ncbi:MAG: hypothetical protein Q9206_004357 [Seirophora lacunosa]
MSYIYFNRYLRFHGDQQAPDPLDPYVRLTPPSKSTESPRRLSSILLPAYTLLHPSSSPSDDPPLTIPSSNYDALRATLVEAELILLRVLGFELRLPSPLKFLQRYLERAMEGVHGVGEDYDAWDKEGREEYGALDGLMETRLGRRCRAKTVEA